MSNKINLDASAKKEIGHAWKESAYYADAEKWTNIIFWRSGNRFQDDVRPAGPHDGD